ncbi:MAG TPA: hypothetical protein VM934_04535 [Pyrinomonadaceae bacterium]|jgi:hypothetical protein|nr:hypothetical protein [Pyrinomonadaceae bacterium]
MVRPVENGGAGVDNTQNIDAQPVVAENLVAQNTDAGSDSVRGEFFLQESFFRFRFQPTGDTNAAAAPTAQAVDQGKVDAAVKLIQEKLDESGWFGDVTHSELEDIERTVSGLTPQEATAVFDRLSDGNLRKWAEELNSGAWFGAGGFDGSEKSRLFNMLAAKLDGNNLSRFSAALQGEDSVKEFGRAVAAHGSDASKEAFVRATASRAETDPAAAVVVAEVIASMRNNPAALQRTLSSLTQTQIDKIVESSAQKHQYTQTNISGYGPPTSTTTITYDAAPLGCLLDAVATTSDPKLKAAFFEPAARQLKEIEEAGSVVESLGGVVYFKKDSVSQIRNGLTNVIDSDTTGVVGQLETLSASYTGKGLTAYLKSMLNGGQEKKVGELVTRMLLGNDLKGNAVQRFRAQSPGNTGDSLYDNAENLGYFLGAVRAAARQISDDTGKQADFIKNIFGAVLGTAGAAGTGPGLAATGLNWLSSEVINSVSARVKDGRTNIFDALIQLGLPRVDANTVYDGPAEAAFKSGFGFVVDNG